MLGRYQGKETVGVLSMGKEKVDVLVKGGEATPAPPIGPSLSPLGVNVGLVVKEINEKTSGFKGMEVPVKIIVDSETKKFTIEVGTPPVTALLKKELKVQKLATVNEDKSRKMAGDLPLDVIVKVAKSKDSIKGSTKAKVKQVLGTCVSAGITVNGKNPKEIIKEINNGLVKVE
jgi:large subunit ribosomal protein L11